MDNNEGGSIAGLSGKESKEEREFRLKEERKRDTMKTPGSFQPDPEEAEKQDIHNEKKGIKDHGKMEMNRKRLK